MTTAAESTEKRQTTKAMSTEGATTSVMMSSTGTSRLLDTLALFLVHYLHYDLSL